jgi:hypothetical protein
MTEQLVEDADALAQNLAAMVVVHPGRLVAVTVTAPAALGAHAFAALFEERLSAAGLDLIDVAVRPAPGPPRIIAMEFER